ncbi:hypothetical protein [Haladaptatus halobius]|uniref:hypothetical protein n=1 Tax=Haladaptatus halobius TaxID=2884875 RepID=UPI001D09AADC|nr:hypothetical protein [Haladaptatus halobius]
MGKYNSVPTTRTISNIRIRSGTTRKARESQQVEDKYLDVLERAKNVTKTKDVMVALSRYREVAAHYGCTYKNDRYRVMEERAERVPGVSYKESQMLSVDDAMDVGGHHIKITFGHPDLQGWMRAHEANAEIKNRGR